MYTSGWNRLRSVPKASNKNTCRVGNCSFDFCHAISGLESTKAILSTSSDCTCCVLVDVLMMGFSPFKEGNFNDSPEKSKFGEMTIFLCVKETGEF